jgi:hypothetical protein
MITLNKRKGANKLNLKVSIVYEQLFFLISGSLVDKNSLLKNTMQLVSSF